MTFSGIWDTIEIEELFYWISGDYYTKDFKYKVLNGISNWRNIIQEGVEIWGISQL